jgi:AbrB family looped-hinge helix DNA binding protein
MPTGEKRTVGDRGQVTIPKGLREAFGIEGGDEVVVHEESNKIVIEKPVSREDLAEGYRRRAERDARLADELAGVSREADARLDDAPEW